MCIRDRSRSVQLAAPVDLEAHQVDELGRDPAVCEVDAEPCLLYTSDAADERSSVDLGGRRIIKKKKQVNRRGRRDQSTQYARKDVM
mgnify:CR=1 FL=1